MSCCSGKRLPIRGGGSHEREFRGAWLRLGGLVRGRARRWGPVCSERQIYLPDKLGSGGVRCETPAGVPHQCECLSVSGEIYSDGR